MGYVFDFNDSKRYDTWFDRASNQYAFQLETRLLLEMLSPVKGARLLDIGCGSGRSLEPFLDLELQLTGVDPSAYMLDIAHRRLKSRADLHRGVAEDLPFDDNTFNYSIFFTSLEFTDRPAKAIEEACRVTKDSVFIGVLNRYAPLNLVRRAKSVFVPSIFSQIRFFSIWELKQILFAILGDVPVTWKTTLQCPWVTGRIPAFFENMRWVRRSPFGTLIGMEIKPVPKFRTRPLNMKTEKARAYRPVSGYARQFQKEFHENAFLRKTG